MYGEGWRLERDLSPARLMPTEAMRFRSNLHPSPDTTLPSAWFRLATPSAPPAVSGSATGTRTPVSRKTSDHQLPQVALFEYNGNSALI